MQGRMDRNPLQGIAGTGLQKEVPAKGVMSMSTAGPIVVGANAIDMFLLLKFV